MTKPRDQRKQTALARRPQEADYEVGYGKPPKETRFKPGVSGNPRGRPRGAKNKTPALHEERLKQIVFKEAYRDVTVREGDKAVSVPMAQAIVRSLALSAAKGNHRAQKTFTEMLAVVERDNRDLNDRWLETIIDYKVGWEREIERCKALGLEPPDPVPHPDQIHIDFRTGEATVTGPMTREERDQLELLRGRKRVLQDALARYREKVDRYPTHSNREFFDAEIAHIEELLGLFANLPLD